MKYHETEISDLDDWSLIEANNQCGQLLSDRDKASQHEKFGNGKLAFPPPNPNFIKMKNEIDEEMKKRKLT